MKRDVVIIPPHWKYYYIRTNEELAAARERDIAAGRHMDSAGEPLLYSKIAAAQVSTATTVMITKKRGITWDTWLTRPRHLVEGLATINGVPRFIMFVMHSKLCKTHREEE